MKKLLNFAFNAFHCGTVTSLRTENTNVSLTICIGLFIKTLTTIDNLLHCRYLFQLISL